MKRLFPYIVFACLTGFTATTGKAVVAVKPVKQAKAI